MTQYERDIESGRVDPLTEPKADGRTLSEYLVFTIENKSWLEQSFMYSIYILDELEKQNISIEQFSQNLGVTTEETRTYLKGDYDYPLSLISKINTILNINTNNTYTTPVTPVPNATIKPEFSYPDDFQRLNLVELRKFALEIAQNTYKGEKIAELLEAARKIEKYLLTV